MRISVCLRGSSRKPSLMRQFFAPNRVFTVVLGGVLLTTLAVSWSPQQNRLDWLIVGARVLDGTENPWRHLNVGIHGDRIAWLAPPSEEPPASERTVNADGLYLSPGFIDLHTHATSALGNPRLSPLLNYLYQGVTTVFVGNDGGGPWPLDQASARYTENGIGPNVCLLVGHGTLRRRVLQMSDSAPTTEELNRLKELTRTGMRDGAWGLSTGLYYAPGSYAQTEEIIAMAREAGSLGGFYDSHIRDESDYTVGVVESIRELLRIGFEAEIPVHVSHIKALGPGVWGRSSEVIRLVEEARAQGLEVTANQYPYAASSTSVTGALVPRWAQVGGNRHLLTRLDSPNQSARIRRELETNIARRGGADKLQIASYAESTVEGKTLQELSRDWDMDPPDAAIRLLRRGGAGLISFNMNPLDVRSFMTQRWVATASDGGAGAFGKGKPHPRGYGTFPRKISKYVREENWIELPFAIRAATSLPARIARIPQRGTIREDYFADLVLFDLENFDGPASYQEPHQYAQGVRFLFVNGEPVIADGQFTGSRPGRVLPGPAWKDDDRREE